MNSTEWEDLSVQRKTSFSFFVEFNSLVQSHTYMCTYNSIYRVVIVEFFLFFLFFGRKRKDERECDNKLVKYVPHKLSKRKNIVQLHDFLVERRWKNKQKKKFRIFIKWLMNFSNGFFGHEDSLLKKNCCDFLTHSIMCNIVIFIYYYCESFFTFFSFFLCLLLSYQMKLTKMLSSSSLFIFQ